MTDIAGFARARRHAPRRGAARAAALLLVASENAAHHLHRMVLRCVRLDHHRLCAAAAHRPMASKSAADRLVDRDRFRRPARRRHRVRLDRRALGAPALDAGDAAHFLARALWPAPARRATTMLLWLRFRSGHRAGRRNSADGRLRQRIRQSQGPRPLLALGAGLVLGRLAGGGARFRLCRAALGLAVDVHHRRHPGAAGDSDAERAAGIAALARQPGPLRRGGPRLDSGSKTSPRARARRSRRCRPIFRRWPRLGRASPNCSRASICAARSRCGCCGSAPISYPTASPPGCRRCSAPSIISTSSNR